jgi:CheY-like chemotaxis protein
MNFSPANPTHRPYDGSVGVKPATRASYRSHPVGEFRLLRAHSVGGDFIASLLSQWRIIWTARCLSQIERLFQSMAVPRERPMMSPDYPCIPAVVLVVEDEMMLRLLAVDIVEDAGYTPLEATDAAEAVAILESRSDVVLMCTDIQMPGEMDGMGLAHVVHERWPTIEIIVVSGQLKLSNLDLPPRSRFFSKPLDATEVIAGMRGMIGHA